ncbi:unnamed protein product [Psylliodes chrysocephalus]|uniref:Uncharacterized protein n=1 Tax=Psylliodes chrysocephalus TaxID=3402493 RepID=A0A9P0GDR5_9CUCU|nr:unnamed protein product [Psylliodes chrysocephala]
MSGCVWLPLSASRCVWLPLPAFRRVYLLLAVSIYDWLRLTASGCVYLRLDASGCVWLCVAASNWKSWVLNIEKIYWLMNRKSKLSIENKLLIYKQVLKPVWIYGI